MHKQVVGQDLDAAYLQDLAGNSQERLEERAEDRRDANILETLEQALERRQAAFDTATAPESTNTTTSMNAVRVHDEPLSVVHEDPRPIAQAEAPHLGHSNEQGLSPQPAVNAENE